MSRQKTAIGNISQQVLAILQEYGQGITETVNDIIPDVAKDTAKQIRANIDSAGIGKGRNGKYAKGWSVSVEKTGTGDMRAVVYNRTPGLPHLLEFDHALRQGGRTKPHEHIAPAEEWAEKEIVKRVKGAL